MKLLQNPIAVTTLAVLAGAYTVWTIMGSKLVRARFTAAATSPAPAAPLGSPLPNALAPPAPQSAQPGLPPSRTSAQLAELRSHAPRWIEAPARDPFRMDVSLIASNGPRAQDVLALQAIWRQSGSALAILNHQILRQGEQLLGYDVETIDADGVWVRSPAGRERVAFPASSTLTAITEPASHTVTASIPISK